MDSATAWVSNALQSAVGQWLQVDFDHPVLAAFDDPRAANLAGVTFQGLWTVEPAASNEEVRAP